jgi:hypothetical protein
VLDHREQRADGDDARKRIWLHPELSGTDIDLPVITSNAVPQEGLPKVDFHEFYWSHLMSETRAVAVLLWLFELARKGPRLNPGIGALWWGSAIFLSFLILSVTFLIIQGIEWSAGASDNRALLLLAPVGLVVIVTIFAALVFTAERALKLARATALVALVASILLAVFFYLHMQDLIQVKTRAMRSTLASAAAKFACARFRLTTLILSFSILRSIFVRCSARISSVIFLAMTEV